MATPKGKYVSFANQREQCRLNKYTYEDKCECGIITLMCNYPFSDPKHKKGKCRASTCTDMRKTLAEDIKAIAGMEADVIKDDIAQLAHKESTPEAVDTAAVVDDATEEVKTAEEEAGIAHQSAAEEKLPDPKGSIRAE